WRPAGRSTPQDSSSRCPLSCSAASRPARHAGGYTYRATIPATEIKEGCFRYNIVVCQGDKRQTFPSGVARNPGGQPKVLIRGFSTINLSTDPLYVVDG
ncbi:hypothetical protein PZH42_30000, partial [Bacteroides cellulosilyticus]